jgi:TRAP-type C4-dicarboxylate transport system permease small subunit
MNVQYPRLEKCFGWSMTLFLSIMVALTFFDVLGRKLFNMPIYGAHDITEHLMAIIIFCGLPLLTSRRAHLTVDLINSRLISRYMPWWTRLVDILIAIVLAVISLQYAIAAHEAVAIQEVSQELVIPRSGMYVMISITSGLAALASLRAMNRINGSGDSPKEMQP